MKKVLSVIILLACCICTTVSAADLQTAEEEAAIDYAARNTEEETAFDYAAQKSAVENWEQLTYPEKVQIYKIPNSVLDNMDTEQVVQAVMDYPYLVDLLLFNTREEGYNHVLECSDALRELEQRADGLSALLDYYHSMPVPLISREKGDTRIIELLYVEILISNIAGKKEISENQMEELITVASDKQAQMQQAPELYGEQAGLEIAEAVPLNIEFTTHTTVSLKGKMVTVIHYLTDLTEAQKVSLNLEHATTYPDALFIATSTKNYNCASYAMVSRSISNPYWLNDLSPVNAGYTRISGDYGADPSDARAGNIIYYATPDDSSAEKNPGSHVGVVQRNNGSNGVFVRSKWGEGPLVEHRLEDCPYYLDRTSLIYYN